MRIIGGKNSGRKLLVPKGSTIRPTSDRIRESVFDILNSYLEHGFYNKVVADLFAGTGALGIEALSRGAHSAILVDNQPEAIKLIQKNVQIFSEEKNTFVLKRDATRIGSIPNSHLNANIVFLDPPYGKNLITTALKSLIDNEWLARDALCVIEMSAKETFNCSAEFERVDERRYGRTMIYIIKFKR